MLLLEITILYSLKDKFIFQTQINLTNDITYWNKTKYNKIVICSENVISFYGIKNNNFIKTQNDITIEEEAFIENSSYLKYKKEEKINSNNLLILKIYDMENDYIVIIKKEISEIQDIRDTDDCPCCNTYLVNQTNIILLSILKLTKKEHKIKIICEFELKNKFEHDYSVSDFVNKNPDPLYNFNESIINSIEFLENKIMFYNPELNNIKIIDVNKSFGQKYESILYNSGEIRVRYKIIFISEKCFFRFKYKYENYAEDILERELTFINDNEENNEDKYIILIKKMNSLLFLCDSDTLTIYK